MRVDPKTKKILLEEGDWLEYPNGDHLFITTGHGINGTLHYGGGHTIHTYTGELSEADVEVCVYDNINLKIHRGRKSNPLIEIEHDEWPCTVKIKDNSKNMKVIVEREK